MPLEHSRSPASFTRNVKTLMGEVGKSPHVQSPQQALAIAYSVKRGRADGGVAGGDVPVPTPDPRTQAFVLGAIQDYAAKTGRQPENMTGADVMRLQRQIGVTGGRPDRANGGVAGFAYGGAPGFGGNPLTNWQERQEARNMHTGPVLSSVAGRTDHLSAQVPSGSFVLPADHLSALGQGNTLHGMSVVNSMFKPGGPYSMGRTMPMGRGMGMPKAPALPKFGLGGGADEGGARGDHVGHPVDVMIAGGEHVLSPQQVMAVGHKIAVDLKMKNVTPDKLLKMGHRALDLWVVNTRKKHIATLRKLPPPATR